MKKIVLLVGAALLSVGAFAQGNSRGVEYGVKAGLNLAKQTKVLKAKMRPGFYVGAFAEYGFGNTFGLQAELLFQEMGVRQKDSGTTTTAKVNYLTLPVIAKFYLYRGLSLDLGPQFGYLTTLKTTSKASNGEKTTVNWYKDSSTRKFDVAFAMGLSFRFANRMDVSARYNLGLTEVAKRSKSKNNVIALGAGYRF